MAKHFGFHNLINASTGSAGLATSAYSARAGMRAAILVPAGVPIERVAPMQAYGAFVLGLVGTIQNALDFVEEICAKLPVFETTTHRPSNPYQNEGTKTIAFELFEQLGGAPDWVILPRASGGTLAAIWRGFDELRQMGLVDHGPHCVASELSRLNTFERAIKEGAQLDAEIRQISGQMDENIVTVGVKLAHAYPVDGEEALSAIRSSGGTAVSVTDEEIMAALLLVAQKDGLFCEPSSATSVAAYQKLIEQGVLKPSDTVVCLLTGSGYREMPVICQAIQPRFPQVNITQALDRLTEFYHVS
jgi:threonine synthase